MPSRLFPKAREAFATAALNWTSEAYGFKAVALPASFTITYAEENLDDIAEVSRITLSNSITNRTAVDGNCTADPIALLPTNDARFMAQLLIFKDTEVESTSLLVAHYVVGDIIGAPIASGGYYVYAYPSGGGYFRL